MTDKELIAWAVDMAQDGDRVTRKSLQTETGVSLTSSRFTRIRKAAKARLSESCPVS